MSDLLLHATAKAGLSEDDPLYAVVAAQSEMIEGFLAEMNRKIAIHKASTPKLSGVRGCEFKFTEKDEYQIRTTRPMEWGTIRLVSA
jgi:hypothetical protein